VSSVRRRRALLAPPRRDPVPPQGDAGGRGLGIILLAALPVVTMLGVSAPAAAEVEIAQGLSTSTGSTAWVLVAFTLGIGLARPAMGRLTDVAGIRGLLVGGSVGLLVGTAGTLVSASLVTMIASRLVQGVSTSALVSGAFTAVAVRLAEPHRSRMLGGLTAGSCLLMGGGPLLGAVMMSIVGWRATVAVPGVAAAFGLSAVRFVGKTSAPGSPLDLAGATLLLVVSACGLTIIQYDSTGLTPTVMTVLCAVGLMACWALARHTRRRPDGFIPVCALARNGLPWQMATATALSAFAFAVVFLAPILLAAERPSWTPIEIGLALAPAGAIGAATAIAAGRRTARGEGSPHLLALALVGLMTLILAWLDDGAAATVLSMAAAVAAFGGTQVILSARIAHVVPRGEVGIVLGIFSLLQLAGGSTGAAVGGALLGATSIEVIPLLLSAFPVVALAAVIRAQLVDEGLNVCTKATLPSRRRDRAG
jgi:MFS transporter, DHA2 family, metal-tetracycline-proton antiporter